MEQVREKVKELQKKGIPLTEALKQLGVPQEQYFEYQRENKARTQVGGEEPARQNTKGVRYDPDSFAEIRRNVLAMMQRGFTKAQAMKRVGITPATYAKWDKCVPYDPDMENGRAKARPEDQPENNEMRLLKQTVYRQSIYITQLEVELELRKQGQGVS